MKKLTMITSLFFVIVHSCLMAQIKVNSSGYVGINNTSPTYRLDVDGTVRFLNSSLSISWDGTSLGPLVSGVNLGTNAIRWYNFYTTYGYFTYAPIVQSDLNLKTDIVNLSEMNDKIQKLRPVSYRLKPDVAGFEIDKSNNSKQYGFIAQELIDIFPDMVKENNGVLGISYTELIPVLVQALKEQQVEIEELNARIASLEKTIK